MKNFFKTDKKYRDIALLIVYCAFLILAAYEILTNLALILSTISAFLSGMFKTIAPVVYACVIAYLLHKPCNKLTNLLIKIKFFSKRQGIAKVIAVLSANIIALMLIVLLFYSIIPNSVESISQIVSRSNEVVEPVQSFIKSVSDNELVIQILKAFDIDIQNLTTAEVAARVLSYAQKILDWAGTYLVGFVIDLGTFLYNFIFGFIIAIYINLNNKELSRQIKKVLIAVFGKFYPKLCETGKYADKMFFGYLTGKALCSAMIGVVVYLICIIFKVQYSLLTAVVLAVTNLIPIFGPWIGAVPCIIFALLQGMRYAIVVAAAAIFAQQLDNNIIGPKIIGDQVNLNGFWVIVSLLVCGKLWGLMGMIIAIPLFAVLRKLIGELLALRIQAVKKKATLECDAAQIDEPNA